MSSGNPLSRIVLLENGWYFWTLGQMRRRTTTQRRNRWETAALPNPDRDTAPTRRLIPLDRNISRRCRNATDGQHHRVVAGGPRRAISLRGGQRDIGLRQSHRSRRKPREHNRRGRAADRRGEDRGHLGRRISRTRGAGGYRLVHRALTREVHDGDSVRYERLSRGVGGKILILRGEMRRAADQEESRRGGDDLHRRLRDRAARAGQQ